MTECEYHQKLLEEFLEQYQRLYLFSADPEGRQEKAFIKFASGKMAEQDCIDVLDEHNSRIYDDYMENR